MEEHLCVPEQTFRGNLFWLTFFAHNGCIQPGPTAGREGIWLAQLSVFSVTMRFHRTQQFQGFLLVISSCSLIGGLTLIYPIYQVIKHNKDNMDASNFQNTWDENK